MSGTERGDEIPEGEWLYTSGRVAFVGITAPAADALGSVVTVDLPPLGATLVAGECCGQLRSADSEIQLYAPADGEVSQVNGEVMEDPSLINHEPFAGGWLFKIALTDERATGLHGDSVDPRGGSPS